MKTLEKIPSREFADGTKTHSWEYRRLPVEGVGPSHLPFIDLEPHLDLARAEELHDEINFGLAGIDHYSFPNVNGAVPEELAEFPGQNHPKHIIQHIEDYDPTGKHKAAIERLPRMVDKLRYATYALGAIQEWQFSVFLLENHYVKFQEQGTDRPIKFDPEMVKVTKHAHRFPKVMKFIGSLPFEYLTRCLIFGSHSNAEAHAHRDWVRTSEHRNHHICFNFGPGRKAYVYDCEKREKIYVRDGCKAYLFNDQDYHGVDPTPVFSYTLRVDGVFTDEFCEALGFVDKKISGYA